MMVHRRMWALAGDIRGALTVNVGLGVAVTASYVIQGILVAQVFALLLTGSGLEPTLPYLAGLLGAMAARFVLLFLAEVAAQRTANAVKERLRMRLFDALVRQGPGYLTLRRSGDVATTLVDGVEALEAYYSRYLPTAVVTVLGPVGILAYLATRDLVSVAVIVTCVVGVLLVPRLWDRLLARTGESHWQEYGNLSADYLDAMQGMTTLKAFNATGRERKSLAARAERLRRATMRQLAVSLVDSGITTYGQLLGSAVAVGVGALRVANGSLDLLTLLTVLVLSRECFRPLGDLSRYWHAGYTGITSAKDIEALLTAPPLVREAQQPVRQDTTLEATVAFENVTFAYPDRTETVLRDFTLEIRPGETVAVVGPSGAGKTTLVSLLLRFFDVGEGRVLLGGVDVRDIPLDLVRAQVSVVAQDTYLFTGTVADNLRLGRPDASDDQVRACAVAAGAHDFIMELPHGYDTEVSERGLSLSGGQRQRIAIARALLKDAPILVLDEATSSVDSANEATIQDALRRIAVGRTTLVIAHRLSTVRDADRIVLLKDGTIREAGRHQELLDRKGDYARLVAAQEVSP